MSMTGEGGSVSEKRDRGGEENGVGTEFLVGFLFKKI